MSIHESGVAQKPDLQWVELPIRMRAVQLKQMEAMRVECGLGSLFNVFHEAMALFLWAMLEVKRGRRIASFDEATDQVEMFHIPAFAQFDSFDQTLLKQSDVPVKKSWLKRLLGDA